MNHTISHKKLTIDYVKTLLAEGTHLELGKEAEAAIVKCRKFRTPRWKTSEGRCTV